MTEPPATTGIDGNTPMSDVLRQYPGAQRALFARYHIGGCSSCGFRPDESLAEVCQRNEDVPVDEVIAHIRDSHEKDASIMVSPKAAAELQKTHPELKLVDLRTREEHEAVSIPGSILLTQDLIQEAFANWDKTQPVVLYDHTGSRAMDATAYFIGHGFAEARCMEGGIDAYSMQVDSSLPRYRIELED
jgi:rhodanese-related sulfurtransferase